MWCRQSGPIYHLLGHQPQQGHWIHQTNLVRKWRSLPLIGRRCVYAIVFLIITLLLGYNFFTCEFYLRQLSPRVKIHSPERARCCVDQNTLDMCGRPDCVESCPSKKSNMNNLKIKKDSVFFHETSGSTFLNFRQACVVESMAYRNPNLTVNVLMTGTHVESNTLTIKNLIEHYPNLKITSIDLGDYLTGTPLESWYYCTEWYRGWFAVAHLSDALRFLSLYKYGGYYFDLDIIQLRPIPHEYRNFIVPEDMGKLGSSVLHVDYPHPIMEMAVREFAADYKWYIWAHNGPELITRILQRWCNVYYITWMNLERCKGFRVLTPESFYPVHYKHVNDYFNKLGDDARRLMESWDESVIGAHVWNSLSAGAQVKKESNQLYIQIARASCPRTLQVAPEEF